MKRFIGVLVFVGLMMLIPDHGQAQFKKGDNLLNLGIGLNSYYSGGLPVSAAYEYGVSKVVSVGGGIDYLSYHYYNANTTYGFSAIYVGGRVSYHFNELFNINDKQWDLYGGGSLGYRSFTWSDKYSNGGLNGYYGNGLFLGVHAGARYYFSQNVGAFLEVGALGSTNIRTGFTFKF
jgi:hypothetical protein